MADGILKGGIYAIRNVLTGVVYVGSTNSFLRRFKTHRSRLKCGNHHSIRLQRAWVKDGEGAFVFEALEVVTDRDQIMAREQFYIDALGAFGEAGYNMRPDAGSMRGFEMTDAVRAKISAAMAGKPRPYVSESLRGRKLSAEHVEKVAASHRGKKRSDEARARISEASKGHQRWLGKTHSEQTKALIGAKARARTTSPDWPHCEKARENLALGRMSRAMRIEIAGVSYSSQAEASKALGLHRQTISKMVLDGRARKIST